jgi:hypothetical protein
VPDSFYEEADSCVFMFNPVNYEPDEMNPPHWIMSPKPKMMNPGRIMKFLDLIHILWCGIRLTLLRTRFEKQIISVREMNPRQQKMNPDAKKGQLRCGFRLICADSLYEHADSATNNADSVKSVTDS